MTDGEPCWIQLSTDDVDTAISFYGDLFGWSAGEPSEEHRGYRMFFRGEQPIAGLVPRPTTRTRPGRSSSRRPTWPGLSRGPQRPGAPWSSTRWPSPTWARSPSSGTRPAPLWGLAGRHVRGVRHAGEPGAPGWFETLSTAYGDAVAFYQRAFGWETHVMSDTTGVPLHHARPQRERQSRDHGRPRLPGRCAGPMAALSPGRRHRRHRCASALRRRQVVRAAEDTPYGRIATLEDPAGVEFCVMRAAW